MNNPAEIMEPLDVRIVVHATKTMKKQLSKLAKRHKVSAGTVARQALHDYLFKHEN